MGTAVVGVGLFLGASTATAAAVGTAAIVGVAGLAAQQYSAYKERGAIEDAAKQAASARVEAATIAGKQRTVIDKTRPDLADRNIDPLTGEERDKRRKKATAKSRFKVQKETAAATISDQTGVQTPATTQASISGVQL